MSQPERLGRYTILRLLGSGAMGDVFLAEDPQIERRLAIKTVRLGGSDEDVQERKARLLREAKAAGKLIHPHVVTLFDYGEDQGVVYLAFEYVEGEDLRRRIDRAPPLTLREALTLIRQTADALAIAHRHSIVHRDIKPANVLVTASGDAKVTDFGIAKLRDEASNLTMSGSIIGTPHYMSPEQVKGEMLDGRSDLFSLGSVLYEILHGIRPFQADSLTTVVYLILHHDPFEKKRPDLPPAIDDLLERMLAKEHDRRFERCEEVVEAIDRLLAELPANQLASPAIGPCPPAPAVATTQMLGHTTPLSATLPRSPTLPPPAPPNQGPPTHAPWTSGPAAAPPLSGATGTASGQPATPAAPPLTGYGAGPPCTSVGTSTSPATWAGAQAATSRPRRTGLWVLAGCVVVPLLAIAVVGIVAWPRVGRWIEEQRASLTVQGGGTDPDVSSESPGDGEVVADLDVATPAPGLAEDAEAEDGDGETPGEPVVEDAPAQDPSRSAAEPDRPSARPQQPQTSTPSTSRPSDQRSSTRPATNPSNGRRTSPTPAPATPTEPEPDPTPTRREIVTEDQPVVREIPFDSQLSAGLRLSIQVEPEEAFVLLRSAFDDRFTVVGQAQDFDATKRRGQPFALPSDGVFYVMLRAEGFADYTVKVDASSSRGAVTTLSLKMGRPGQRAAASAQGTGRVIEVRQGITFADGPKRAKVEVDGQDKGQLRRYQDGSLLPLEPGRHRVVISQGSQRWELEVDVTSGASSDRQVVTIGAND